MIRTISYLGLGTMGSGMSHLSLNLTSAYSERGSGNQFVSSSLKPRDGAVADKIE